ncbi:MAG: hypothetical protein HOP06_05835 [Methylotenera sp.]|nr:hypothetical protein [Methylotenera sp.]
MTMTHKTNKWISRIFIIAKLISRNNVLNKYLLVLILLLNATAANAEVELRSLQFRKEYISGNANSKLPDGKSYSVRLAQSYDETNRIPENPFGLSWCPLLRDEGPSLMPLQVKIRAEKLAKDEVSWGECNWSFRAQSTLKFVKSLSSDLKGRSVQDILNGQYAAGEHFFFLEKNAFAKYKEVYEKEIAPLANDLERRKTYKLSKFDVIGIDELGTTMYIPNYKTSATLDKKGQLTSISSTERTYKIINKADGNIDRIIYEYLPKAKSADVQAANNIPTEIELMKFSYRDNGLLEKVIFDKDTDHAAEFSYDAKRHWVQIINAWRKTYKLTYNDEGSLKDMLWPDETMETIFYNATTGHVSGFLDRNGCMLTYKFVYGKNEQNYKTFETKTCSGKVIHVREFSLITNENGEEKESITTLDAEGQVKR